MLPKAALVGNLQVQAYLTRENNKNIEEITDIISYFLSNKRIEMKYQTYSY